MPENFIKKCNICKKSSFLTVKNFEKFYLNKCTECNFVFSKKIPSTKEMQQCYDAYDRNNNLSLISLNNIKKIVISHIKKFKPSNVLDIGCGNGDFLDFYKANGIKTYFTEYGEFLINKLKKNHEFVKGGICPESKEKFDIIILSEVIEHTYEPDKLINYINKIQKKNGILYITTPNYNSLEKFFFKSNYSIFTYPEHLSYFTTKTLHKLLINNGYKKIYIYSENISLFRVIEFFKYKKININKINNMNKKIQTIDSNKLSNKIQKIANLSGLIFVKNFISIILRILGLGNTIKATYIKL